MALGAFSVEITLLVFSDFVSQANRLNPIIRKSNLGKVIIFDFFLQNKFRCATSLINKGGVAIIEGLYSPRLGSLGMHPGAYIHLRPLRRLFS